MVRLRILKFIFYVMHIDRCGYWSFTILILYPLSHLGGNEGSLVGMNRDPVPTCKAFVGNVVVLSLLLYHMYEVYGTTVFR